MSYVVFAAVCSKLHRGAMAVVVFILAALSIVPWVVLLVGTFLAPSKHN